MKCLHKYDRCKAYLMITNMRKGCVLISTRSHVCTNLGVVMFTPQGLNSLENTAPTNHNGSHHHISKPCRTLWIMTEKGG